MTPAQAGLHLSQLPEGEYLLTACLHTTEGVRHAWVQGNLVVYGPLVKSGVSVTHPPSTEEKGE